MIKHKQNKNDKTQNKIKMLFFSLFLFLWRRPRIYANSHWFHSWTKLISPTNDLCSNYCSQNTRTLSETLSTLLKNPFTNPFFQTRKKSRTCRHRRPTPSPPPKMSMSPTTTWPRTLNLCQAAQASQAAAWPTFLCPAGRPFWLNETALRLHYLPPTPETRRHHWALATGRSSTIAPSEGLVALRYHEQKLRSNCRQEEHAPYDADEIPTWRMVWTIWRSISSVRSRMLMASMFASEDFKRCRTRQWHHQGLEWRRWPIHFLKWKTDVPPGWHQRRPAGCDLRLGPRLPDAEKDANGGLILAYWPPTPMMNLPLNLLPTRTCKLHKEAGAASLQKEQPVVQDEPAPAPATLLIPM